MRRGFKTEAEQIAGAARKSLGLAAAAVLDPWAYAKTLGAVVVDADKLDLSPNHAAQLLQTDSDSWSGMTLAEDGVLLIVLNTSHSRRRQAATLAHELAHSILGHTPTSVQLSSGGMVLLSDYSDDQEAEADWLGGALLLPHAALLYYRTSGKSVGDIARLFGVSDDLCHWRCRMTGVEKRLAFRARA